MIFKISGPTWGIVCLQWFRPENLSFFFYVAFLRSFKPETDYPRCVCSSILRSLGCLPLLKFFIANYSSHSRACWCFLWICMSFLDFFLKWYFLRILVDRACKSFPVSQIIETVLKWGSSTSCEVIYEIFHILDCGFLVKNNFVSRNAVAVLDFMITTGPTN